MKNIPYVVCLGVLTFVGMLMGHTPVKDVVNCTGALLFPSSIVLDQVPQLFLFYHGQQIALHTTKEREATQIGYSFLQSKSIKKFYLLIAEQVLFKTALNTVINLQVPAGISYKYYELVATRGCDAFGVCTGNYWSFTPALLPKDRTVSDDAVVILFDAHLVQDLARKSWKEGLQSWFMPDIIIKTTVTQQQIDTACMLSGLAALDLKSVHTSFSDVEQKQSKRAIITLGT